MAHAFSSVLVLWFSLSAWGQSTGEGAAAPVASACESARAAAIAATSFVPVRDEIDGLVRRLETITSDMLRGVDIAYVSGSRVRGIIVNGAYRDPEESERPHFGVLPGDSPGVRRENVARRNLLDCLAGVTRIRTRDRRASPGLALVRLGAEMECQMADALFRGCGHSTTGTCTDYLRDIGGSTPMPRGWPHLAVEAPRFRSYLRVRAAVSAAQISQPLTEIRGILQPALQSGTFEEREAAFARAEEVLEINSPFRLAGGTDGGTLESDVQALRDRLKELEGQLAAARAACGSERRAAAVAERISTRRRTRREEAGASTGSSTASPSSGAGSTEPATP